MSDEVLVNRTKNIDLENKGNEIQKPSKMPKPKRTFPFYCNDRIDFFDELKSNYDKKIATLPRVPLKVNLPNGRIFEAVSWETTPLSLAKKISNSLVDDSVIAKVDGELWDLERPLEKDCSLEILTFDHSEGKQVFWHSSAHILGEAMESKYRGCLCYGPPIEEGFYYDMFIENQQVSVDDFKDLDDHCYSIIKEKQPFVRLEMSKEDLKKMFQYNKFKLRIIEEKINTPTTTVYRCGPLIDLCRGPHIIHTGKIKAISSLKTSSTYWEGDKYAESLQRIYGISFTSEKLMNEWKENQELAAKRDHRKIGREQELFFFHEYSPGSCFFLPKGAHIYNKLMEFIKYEYRERRFTEVVTPNIYSVKLWQTSGHWEHYYENMFSFDVEQEKYALKPMNCPGHCLMFGYRTRSWRELPIRFADFGVLHRNELSGTLTGLTRVRRFQQDDAHIFCTVEQISQEINGCLEFLKKVYGTFGFSMKLNLSTRPDKYLGDLELWKKAESELKISLDNFGQEWFLNEGDGAFYGPKIDIQITDALKRLHQCATIQLDFNLPIRFNLKYVGSDGDDNKRPVIIHRAVLGSVERMIAILIESYGGLWPLWLSPNQIIILPVGQNHVEYSQKIYEKLFGHHLQVELDFDPSVTLAKRIRNSVLKHYCYIIVIGDNEVKNDSINVRTRENTVLGELDFESFIMGCISLIESRSNRLKSEEFKVKAIEKLQENQV